MSLFISFDLQLNLFFFYFFYFFLLIPNKMFILFMKIIYFNMFKTSHLPFMDMKLILIILLANVMGLFFYNLTLTSHICFNLMYTFIYFFRYTIVNRKKWLWHFIFTVPKDCPYFLIGFVCIIEYLSEFVRLWILSLRLFANMLAGHLIMILLSDCNSLFSFTVIKLMLVFFIVCLEIMVSFIQCFIFIMLLKFSTYAL